MSELKSALAALPEAVGAVVVLSGGLDSSTALRLAVEKYGPAKVVAITFFYGQRQGHEVALAKQTCERLGVEWKYVDLEFLGEFNQGFSANTDDSIAMPGINDVIGDPAPKTYVANRNMVMMSIAASLAETRGLDTVICGLQSNDMYNYHDTTPAWVDKLNALLDENRKLEIRVIAPFVDLTKVEEIQAIAELDGGVDFFATTMTCYAPQGELSCGACPSCAERLAAFDKAGFKDPVGYVESDE